MNPIRLSEWALTGSRWREDCLTLTLAYGIYHRYHTVCPHLDAIDTYILPFPLLKYGFREIYYLSEN